MFSFLSSIFTFPVFAGGALAGSIPIIIHLLNKQRFKKVVWSAMHWLWASYKKSRRRLQIEQLILLAIRVLVLVLLALALARPAVQQAMGMLGGRGAVHRVIVLDNSYSMGQRIGGGPLFDKAKRLAQSLVKDLTPNDDVDIILANNVFEETIPAATKTEDMLNQINAAATSDGGTDIPKAIASACKLLIQRPGRGRPEIIVITDQTRNAWENTDGQPRRVKGMTTPRSIPSSATRASSPRLPSCASPAIRIRRTSRRSASRSMRRWCRPAWTCSSSARSPASHRRTCAT